jgi:hypothetical protein
MERGTRSRNAFPRDSRSWGDAENLTAVSRTKGSVLLIKLSLHVRAPVNEQAQNSVSHLEPGFYPKTAGTLSRGIWIVRLPNRCYGVTTMHLGEINMKRLALSLFWSFGVAALWAAAAMAAPPNLTGTWSVQQTGPNGTTMGTLTITQSGNGIVGQNAKTGNGYTGSFVNDQQIDGKWHGPGGAGWLTVYVSPNGHSFNGTWGYNGRAANGSFVGNKVLPPSPITAAGTWNVTVAGGPASFAGPMTCTQSGPSAVCHIGRAVINGKFRTKDKVRATWSNGARSGWFSFWFNGDNNSFNGVWGVGAETTPPVGRVIGQRSLGG